ncbi:MAG: ABC transporter ATP-binding protein, partial [Clostridia bacterium]|nr:ABC transporter ATP-binding protein [Clostridia bacterium]
MNNRKKPNPHTIKRVIKSLFESYPVLFPITIAFILISSAASAIPDIFIKKVIAIIEKWGETGDWLSAKAELVPAMITLVSIYIVALIMVYVYNQLMAVITQGFLAKMRQKMFDGMQNLPIRYFDTHKTGDIMSTYTNDIDTLRQLISQAIPSLLRAGVVVVCVFGVMLYYSIWMTLILVVGVLFMMFVSKKAGSGSAKYFIKQQKSLGRAEGFIQEMMNGQKIIKVFCHENQAEKEFQEINEKLRDDSSKAHAYANSLGPVIMNIGNVLYVIMAVMGGLFYLLNIHNIALSFNPVFSLAIAVTFLNMTKQFTGNLNQCSQQINAIVMALAGAERIFSLMDELPETDNGYVTLVNAVIDDNGNVTETDKRTGIWAWKHPHGDGTLTYTKLSGEVTLNGVDFEYEEGKPVLHDITLYAKTGQKVAFVGATGAGKTTITNLINRFYDIADGKIRYDGININKIKKSDLRRSLGIVLQDTNLFTGTVMDNIRYGKLDATDEECVNAAKLVGADDF